MKQRDGVDAESLTQPPNGCLGNDFHNENGSSIHATLLITAPGNTINLVMTAQGFCPFFPRSIVPA